MNISCFEPFGDDESVLSVGGLSLENGTECMVLHGDLAIPRNGEGVEALRQLVEVLGRVLAKAESASLRVGPGPDDTVVEVVANPFA